MHSRRIMAEHISKRFHIILDAYNCNPAVLDDSAKVKLALETLVGLCEMKILHGPVVLEGVPENPGITGFVVIDFSHISIHTFTATKEMCVDVFSCKPYDYEKVKSYVKQTFELDDRFIEYVEVQYKPH